MDNKTSVFYALGAFGKDAMYAMSIIMNVYFIDYLGMAPAFIGIMFMIVRIWDAVNDPIMGTIVDNTKSRFGKFKPWILLGSVLNAIILILVFFDPGFDGIKMMIYVTLFYTLWGMSYTLMDIPFWSMIPTFSKKALDREKITALAKIFASIGYAVIAAPYLTIVMILGDGDDKVNMIDGFFKLSIIVGVVFLITQIFVFLFVKDRYSKNDQEKLSLKGMFKLLKDNDQLLVVALVIVLFNFVLYITSTMSFFYIKYDIGEVSFGNTIIGYQTLNTLFLGTGLLLQIIAMASYGIFSKRFPRKKIFEAAIKISVSGFILLFINAFIIGNQVILTFLFAFLIFYGLGLLQVSQTVLLTDTVDYGEWKNGRRSESSVFSSQTFVVKMATGLAMGVVGIGLSLVGYNEDLMVQSNTTIIGIRVIMFILPIIGMFIALKIFRKYHKLDETMYSEILLDLEKE